MSLILWQDFETGGVEPWTHSPLSFAMIATKGTAIIGEWYTQIREAPFVVTQEAMIINGLNLSDPGLSYYQFHVEYMKKVNNWFYGGTDYPRSNGTFLPGKTKPSKTNMPSYGGHNTFFDRQVLQRLLGGSPFKNVYDGCYYHRVDTMVLAHSLQQAGIIAKGENLKLETLCKLLDVQPESGSFHNALVDLRMTVKCYFKICSLLTDKVTGRIYDELDGEMADGQSSAAVLGEAHP